MELHRVPGLRQVVNELDVGEVLVPVEVVRAGVKCDDRPALLHRGAPGSG